jgi:hypothetical protein
MKTFVNMLVVSLVLTGLNSVAADKSASGGSEKRFRKTDKLDKVWLAEGFDFTGYDTLLVEEAKVDGSVKAKDEKEADRLSLAQGTLARNFALAIEGRKIFKNVTTKESEVPKEGKSLRMQPTILKFSRGSSAARYGVGFGAGMPYIKVNVRILEMGTDKPLFECELDERADWFAAGYASSRSLQSGASMELTEDVAAFMARVARHDTIKYK